MGNPPFLGGMFMSDFQKKEIREIFDSVTGAGEFDYVTGWLSSVCFIIWLSAIHNAVFATVAAKSLISIP